MRAWLIDDILYLHRDDVPRYKKQGSVVRNTFFWALRSIAGRAGFDQDWEYEPEIWPALSRMLMSFMASGYLPYDQTILEFKPNTPMPEVLRAVATYLELTPEEE